MLYTVMYNSGGYSTVVECVETFLAKKIYEWPVSDERFLRSSAVDEKHGRAAIMGQASRFRLSR